MGGHVRSAVAAVVRDGEVRTADLMHRQGGASAFASGAASTVEMTDAILDALARVEFGQPGGPAPSVGAERCLLVTAAGCEQANGVGGQNLLGPRNRFRAPASARTPGPK
mgnify:CR=1 FL=1